MKLLLFADNHFSETSSIVVKYGDKYTVRLENQIKSIEWLEKLAVERNVDEIICLGDFFDKSSVTDQEITAFNDIHFTESLNHSIVVGNHESSVDGLRFNTSECLRKAGFAIYSSPISKMIDNTQICFLPYITEGDRKTINEYFGEKPANSKRIIFSHNDIAGIQMGPVVSKTGFIKEDIESSCDLFINGHLHNGIWVTKSILNLGNLTGKDFGEDSFKYSHNVIILDTETLKVEFIENPYAFNFYKLDITSESDIDTLKTLKNNAVCSIKCKTKLNQLVRDTILSNKDKFTTYKIINALEILTSDETELNAEDLSMSNYLPAYADLCRAKIDNSDILEAELAEVCK